jgi:hypothetical protein
MLAEPAPSPLRWCLGLLAGLSAVVAVAGVVLLTLANFTTRQQERVANDDPLRNAAIPAPSTPGGEPLPQQALVILKTHCYRCHGENGAAEGGFNFILDRDRLVDRKKIVPGDATRADQTGPWRTACRA